MARPRAKERAEAFVREQLANGPRYGELVKRDATEYAKISERTLIAVGVASIFKLKDLD
jgi:hypothetical protein